MESIVNKVKNSGLISMDLANFKPTVGFAEIDLSEQLWQGLVLREKDFRQWLKTNDWSVFKGKAVRIFCSADAIVPTWAFMLVASQLVEFSFCFHVGTMEELVKKVISKNIDLQNLESYRDEKVIVKGCSDIPFPDFAMAYLVEKMQPVVKSIMYGEPCSTVPIFKKK